MSRTDVLRLPEYPGHILQAIERIHGYFKIDMGIVWSTIHNDLPDLHKQVSKLIEQL